jgi:hypothetical protein
MIWRPRKDNPGQSRHGNNDTPSTHPMSAELLKDLSPTRECQDPRVSELRPAAVSGVTALTVKHAPPHTESVVRPPEPRVSSLGFLHWLCLFTVVVSPVAASESTTASAPQKAGVVRRVVGSTPVDLYLPDTRPAPLVVLSHGFARNSAHHAGNAAHLAKHGFLVAVPEDTHPAALAGLVSNLVRSSTTRGDLLDGRIDPKRVGLAGHSAGAAASVEAAVLMQETSVPVRALCLLDGVPRRSTLDAATRLHRIPFASLRAEPSSCNARGKITRMLARIPFPVDDVTVIGSTHCDQENPSDAFCGLVCGTATRAHQQIYLQLMTFFFEDALIRKSGRTYEAEIAAMKRRGVVRSGR